MHLIGIIIDGQSIPTLIENSQPLAAIAKEMIAATDQSPFFRIIIRELSKIINVRQPALYFKAYQEVLSSLYCALTAEAFSMNSPLINIEIISEEDCGWDPLNDPDLTDLYCQCI